MRARVTRLLLLVFYGCKCLPTCSGLIGYIFNYKALVAFHLLQNYVVPPADVVATYPLQTDYKGHGYVVLL